MSPCKSFHNIARNKIPWRPWSLLKGWQRHCIYRQCWILNTEANTLICKFSVKCFLFYCTPLYMAYFQCSYKRRSLRGWRWPTVKLWGCRCRSLWYTYSTCEALLRGSVCMFMCRLGGSEDGIAEALTDPRRSCSRYVSKLSKHIYKHTYNCNLSLCYCTCCAFFVFYTLLSSNQLRFLYVWAGLIHQKWSSFPQS